MACYLILLEIDDAFYREFHEQGTTKDALMKELQGNIQDQLEEYDFRRLMTQMLSPQCQGEMALAPKKQDEDEQAARFVLLYRDV